MLREFAAFDMLTSDVGLWNTTLRDTMDKALDYGIDSVTVVDQIASTVSSHQCASPAAATHLADLLLSNLDINDARDVPHPDTRTGPKMGQRTRKVVQEREGSRTAQKTSRRSAWCNVTNIFTNRHS